MNDRSQGLQCLTQFLHTLVLAQVDALDIQGLANGLRKHKAGQEVDSAVRRGEQKKTLKLTLGQPKKRA